MDTPLVLFCKHDLWANLRLLDACAGLSHEELNASVAGTFGNVGNTLNHIVESESGYLYRLQTGRPKPSGGGDASFPGIEDLRVQARRNGEGLIEVAERFQPGAFYPVQWKDGHIHDLPAAVYLVQAITHAAEHRSQVLTILTQQGIEVPDLSIWAYCEEELIS